MGIAVAWILSSLPIALAAAGVLDWRSMWNGAAAWAVAVAIKSQVFAWAQSRTTSLPPRGQLVLWGTWSGMTELGIAALAFARMPPLGIPEVVAFGLGAASLENLTLLG